MAITGHTVSDLKAAGHYFAAGALTRELGMARNYGCHFGMRSDLERAKRQYNAGYDAAALLENN